MLALTIPGSSAVAVGRWTPAVFVFTSRFQGYEFVAEMLVDQGAGKSVKGAELEAGP